MIEVVNCQNGRKKEYNIYSIVYAIIFKFTVHLVLMADWCGLCSMVRVLNQVVLSVD